MNYFKPEEFACKCGCGEMDIDPRLLQWLNVMRRYAEAPIHVLSGVRCMKHNKEVHGSPKSQHLPDENGRGSAADIYIKGWDPFKLFERAIMYGAFGGIGIYPHDGFVHVDTRIRTGSVFTDAVRWIELKDTEGKKILLPFNGATMRRCRVLKGDDDGTPPE